MCNDDAKKASNLEKGRCKKMTKGEMRMMNQKQNEDDGEAKHIKRSEDPLKFNMK